MRSFPGPPTLTSLLGVPASRSAPALPTIVAARSAQVALIEGLTVTAVVPLLPKWTDSPL
jgi:hypothetical protein